MPTRLVCLILLLVASVARAAPVSIDSPEGEVSADVVNGRDRNAEATPKPNFWRVLGNNTPGIAVPTPKARECIIGDTDATTATDAFRVDCQNGVAITAPVSFVNAQATPVGSMSSTGTITANAMAIPRPYAQYSTTADQTVASTSAAYTVAFTQEDLEFGLTHPVGGDNSKIQIDSAGAYRIFLSAIADTNTNGSHLDMWLRVDGADVPSSNTRIQLAATTEMTLAVEFLYTFTVGQYFQIAYHGEHTSTALIDTPLQAASPPIPYAPAAILVVSKVSS